MIGRWWLISLAALAPVQEPEVDDRSRVLLRRDCASTVARQEMTLFANGTIRLVGEGDEGRSILLAELAPSEVEAYVRRLEEVDLGEVDPGRPGLLGDQVARCELVLALAGRAERTFWFGALDSLPLALGHLERVARELVGEAERRAPRSRLPADYEPRLGDILERRDGVLFEVVAFTGDGRGVELSGVSQPLVVYVLKQALRDEFSEIVRRRER